MLCLFLYCHHEVQDQHEPCGLFITKFTCVWFPEEFCEPLNWINVCCLLRFFNSKLNDWRRLLFVFKVVLYFYCFYVIFGSKAVQRSILNIWWLSLNKYFLTWRVQWGYIGVLCVSVCHEWLDACVKKGFITLMTCVLIQYWLQCRVEYISSVLGYDYIQFLQVLLSKLLL